MGAQHFMIGERGTMPMGPRGKVVIEYKEREHNRPVPACKKPSEFWWGLPEQPANTCPMIDEGLDLVESAAADLRYAVNDAKNAHYKAETAEEYEKALKSLWDYVETVAGELEDFEIESVRTNAEKLREWGQCWKHQAKALAAGEIPTSKNFVKALD